MKTQICKITIGRRTINGFWISWDHKPDVREAPMGLWIGPTARFTVVAQVTNKEFAKFTAPTRKRNRAKK